MTLQAEMDVFTSRDLHKSLRKSALQYVRSYAYCEQIDNVLLRYRYRTQLLCNAWNWATNPSRLQTAAEDKWLQCFAQECRGRLHPASYRLTENGTLRPRED
jgi:hypothetical protein